jgi:hypothetical protein
LPEAFHLVFAVTVVIPALVGIVVELAALL